MFNIVVLLFTGEQFLSPEDLLETASQGGLLCRGEVMRKSLVDGDFQGCWFRLEPDDLSVDDESPPYLPQHRERLS